MFRRPEGYILAVYTAQAWSTSSRVLSLEPLRPVVTSYTTQPTQNTITSLIAAPLDIRTHMVFALFSGVMYLGSALRGVRWELVPKAALPRALFSPLHISHTAGSELWVRTGSDLARIHTHTHTHTHMCVCLQSKLCCRYAI